MRLLLILLMLLAMAGCGTMQPAPANPAAVPSTKAPETASEGDARRAKAARPTYNLTGYPPAVRDGYIDGCETAKRTPYGRKDATRMSGDPQYAMGWNDGYSICRAK